MHENITLFQLYTNSSPVFDVQRLETCSPVLDDPNLTRSSGTTLTELNQSWQALQEKVSMATACFKNHLQGNNSSF